MRKISAGYLRCGGGNTSVVSIFAAPKSPRRILTYSIGLEQSYLTSEEKGDSPNDESFSIPTSDGKTVRVNLEFSYRFDEARVAETFTTFKGKSGEQIKDTFIKPTSSIPWTLNTLLGYNWTTYNTEMQLGLEKLKSVKCFKNGRVDIRFTSEAFAREFAETFLGNEL